ncbi:MULTISPECIES: hybrid sensor histidine kinase/response regulator [Calditerrivibrio]|uniref:hybrid sensor histidine kinase/response regulator n=1 Tax=Calditerrivibrio TaxID=545865 RepID=UPI003C77AE32
MANIDRKSLVEFFKIESEEHFEAILNGLQTLSIDNENWSTIDEIFRSAHTIKGSAAMVGFNNVSKLAHQLENLFELMRIGVKKFSKNLINRVIFFVEDLFNHLKTTSDDISDDLKLEFSNRLNQIIKESDEISYESDENLNRQEASTVDINTPEKLEKVEKQTSRMEILKKADETFAKISKVDKAEHFAHLKLSQVDFLVNLIGELITYKNIEDSKIKLIMDRFEDLNYATNRLQNLSNVVEQNFSYSYLYKQENQADSDLADEFSLAELDRYDIFNIYSRQLMEIVNDINLSYKDIVEILTDFREDLNSSNRLLDRLRRDITSIRMISVDRLFNNAIMTAKTAAAAENKKIKILFTGEKLSVDQSVFGVLRESFLHIVRNAVSHGIEDSNIRLAAGKDEVGTVILRAQRHENFLVFEVEDDGAGVDLTSVRKKAIEKGVLSEYEAQNMRADKLMELLFLPGFTTKTNVSDISGRGVGLDVVKESVERLGGNVKIHSERGKGTKISITIPMRDVIGEYLYIKENNQLFAVPIIYISSIITINTDMLKQKSGDLKYSLQKEDLNIFDLGVLIKQTNNGKFTSGQPALVLFYRVDKYIVVVDEVLDKVVTVTKPLPSALKNFKRYSGATINAYGQIALIIDPSNLIEGNLSQNIKIEEKNISIKDNKIEYKPNSILIVDDSLSIRKYICKLLDGMGFYYEEATDGVAAINKLRERKFDLIITDLEMPLMNGYELINNIRSEMLDHTTPIFVVTSRATDKHRNKALELGANDFIMKPFDEDEIAHKIREALFGKTTISS